MRVIADHKCGRRESEAALAAICTETSGQLFKLPLPVAMGEGIYRSLTCDQKMLYALLLSKHSLSQRRDASNEPFLILPRTEMIEAVGMAINTATRAMRALASAGLLREKHQGNGEPNRIYLTEFLDPEMRRFFMIPASLYGTGAPEMSSVEKMAICYLCHKRLLQGNEECIEHGLHKVECTRQELAPVLSVNLRGVFRIVKGLKELGFIEVERKGSHSSVITYNLDALANARKPEPAC